MNDFRSSAASSSAAAGDASVGVSAAALNQEDMLALRLQQALRRTHGLQKREEGDHLRCLRVQFRARIANSRDACDPALCVNLFLFVLTQVRRRLCPVLLSKQTLGSLPFGWGNDR